MSINDLSFPHLIPVLLMLGMVALNHVIMHQRTERRYALEAGRLAAALAAELRVLHDLYAKNLELLDTKAGYLMSTRSPVLVYRSNLGRLSQLFEAPIIEHLVLVFAQNERIEALLATHGNSKSGLTYMLTAESRVDELRELYVQTSRDLEWTRRALDGSEPIAKPAGRSLQLMGGLLQSPQPSP